MFRPRWLLAATANLLLLAGAAPAGEWRLNNQHVCVDIPANMSLCRDIGYPKMRLPNLLEHDTLAEACQQAASWVPLLNVQCHPDAQLFLCSLFSPVCLDRPIYPCRSLCQAVKQGCEGRMKTYGFPWPDMFRCDKFPPDDHLCLYRPDRESSDDINKCLACNQVLTYENILDNFCRADFAIRAKFRRINKKKLTCKKAKVLKGKTNLAPKLRHPVLILENEDNCCEKKTRSNNEIYLIMGFLRDHKLVPSFIMPWQTKISKPFKRAVRMFTKLNCTDPTQVSYSVIGNAFPAEIPKKLKINDKAILNKTNRASPRKKKEKNKYKKKKTNNSTISSKVTDSSTDIKK